MDLYFERHDGEAVTIEDFVKCFEDASGRDLTQFSLWYHQAGTPLRHASPAPTTPRKAPSACRCEQMIPPTPGQSDQGADAHPAAPRPAAGQRPDRADLRSRAREYHRRRAASDRAQADGRILRHSAAPGCLRSTAASPHRSTCISTRRPPTSPASPATRRPVRPLAGADRPSRCRT